MRPTRARMHLQAIEHCTAEPIDTCNWDRPAGGQSGGAWIGGRIEIVSFSPTSRGRITLAPGPGCTHCCGRFRNWNVTTCTGMRKQPLHADAPGAARLAGCGFVGHRFTCLLGRLCGIDGSPRARHAAPRSLGTTRVHLLLRHMPVREPHGRLLRIPSGDRSRHLLRLRLERKDPEDRCHLKRNVFVGDRS
jgi:hypothetical protein